MPYKDPEVRKRYMREYRLRNRDRAVQWQRKWRAENLEKARKQARDWARKNAKPYVLSDAQKKAKSERMKIWWAENRDLNRQYESKRRALKRSQFIEDVDPRLVYTMHGGMCGICKEFIEDNFHVDHVIPLAKGGMHGYVNVQPAHPICNLRKGARV